MLRKTPSLEATEAFLFAGRSESFRAAAAELALSPSAFSRRIQQLERFVGVALFDRSGSGVRLTEAGRRYLAEIEPALEIIRQATAALCDGDGGAPMRLAVSHSLAANWLMPRLPKLLHEGGMAVELLAGRGVEALRAGQADLAICGGTEPPSDHASEVLIQLEGVVAAAPVMADGREPPTRAEQLGDYRLLAARTPPEMWNRWLARAGLSTPSERPILFDTAQLMYEAAAGGLGLTLATPMTSERFLSERRLKVCFGDRWPLGAQYRLVFADPAVRRRRDVRRLTHWLTGEIARSAQTFDRLAAGGA